MMPALAKPGACPERSERMVMKVKVGLVGFGVVGTGVVELLLKQAELLKKRSGVEVSLERIADLDVTRDRGVDIGRAKLTADYRDVIGDPDIDIVIELVGGTTVARRVVVDALEGGKHVVTANKALLSAHGHELFTLAQRHERELRHEASVGGGIPIIRVITESLSSDQITRIYGIVNGTTNFILTRMIDEQWSFSDALARAQELGFAEADPTLDVNGSDAAHKIAILASVAFNSVVETSRVHTAGIESLELTDVLYAKELGYVTKLLAVAKLEEGEIMLRVAPTLVPQRCALANVSNEFNAVMLESQYLGASLYVGKGAGPHPTATAVVSDIVDLSKAMLGKREFNASPYAAFNDYRTGSHLDAESRFYLRLSTEERAGIMGVITKTLGDHGISISALVQKEAAQEERIPIVLLTRKARERNLREAVEEIAAFDFVHADPVVLHVENIQL